MLKNDKLWQAHIDFNQHLKQCQSQEAGTCNETIDLSASTAPSNIFRQPVPETTVTIGPEMLMGLAWLVGKTLNSILVGWVSYWYLLAVFSLFTA